MSVTKPAPANHPPPIFDAAVRGLRAARARALFAEADFLHRRVVDDLVDRIVELAEPPALIFELGAGAGLMRAALSARAPPGMKYLFIEGMTARGDAAAGAPRVVLDLERPPLASGRLDLVVSPLALHWANDLVGVLAQARGALRAGGGLIASLLGGGTLTELRQSLMEAEIDTAGGAGPRVSPFLDPADAAGLLQRAGFVQPVVEVERLTVRYAHLLALAADLRGMGETNALIERARRPLSRATLVRADEIYRGRFADADGRLRATFDIVTLTGWSGPAAAGHSQSRSQATRGASAGGIG